MGATTIKAEHGDLTNTEVDVVVNAANESLDHGGGLAGAIVRAGGSVIQDESDTWVLQNGPLSPGTAAITGPGTLPCKAIVHVAGPIHRDGQDNEGLLRTAVGTALTTAASEGHRSVALPAISAGIFGYPPQEATAVIASEAASWAAEHPNALRLIRLIGAVEEATEGFAASLMTVL